MILYNLLNKNGKFTVNAVNEIIQKIKKLINGFEQQYPGMKNFNGFPLNWLYIDTWIIYDSMEI